MSAALFALCAVAAAAVPVLRGRKRRRECEIVSAPDFLAKVDAVVADGPQRLVVLVDFDRTATTYWFNRARGQRGHTCHGILESQRGPELRAAAEALNAYYYPIELDPTLSSTEKEPFMRDWYRKINDLLVASNLRRADVVSAVRAASVRLRPGFTDLLDVTRRLGVPVVVFSAGVGDVVTAALAHALDGGRLPAHVHVVSNWIVWRGASPGAAADDGDVAADWSEPLITMFSKNAASMASLPWHAELSGRHAIVVGDSLGDAHMADGLEALGRAPGQPAQRGVVVRVGLLNDNAPALLPLYERAFDVTILDDGDLHSVCAILRDVEDAHAARSSV